MAIHGTFDPTPFAEGRFRRAYMGEYTSPWEKAGQNCVVKELKESYTWKATDWGMTVKIHKEAQELAAKFNQYYNTSHPISFTNIYVQQVSSQPVPYTRPLLNEYVIVEDYIPGLYKKWINNCGYISEEVMSMPAFAHWSWWYTNGEKMIADLQGVRFCDCYVLTDPVLMSGTVNGQMYGCTDTGVEGIAMFFLNHTCNIMCSHLPRPTLQSLGIPPCHVIQQLPQIFNGTVYAHELKLPF